MPRETLDIRDFKYGVISTVDEEDIPSEAASDSLNIDGDVGEGILQGIPADIEYQTSGSVALTNATKGEFIENEGIYYFVYYDKSDNKLKVIKDFYGTKITEELTSYSSGGAITLSSDITFVKENKALRIGVGDYDTLWVGFRDHALFGVTETDIFNGTHLDDMTGNVSGYNKVKSSYYRVTIYDIGTPDRFTWSKDGGVSSSITEITGASQSLSDGVTITFSATIGHTAGESWVIMANGITVEKAKCEDSNGTSATEFNLAQVENLGAGYFESGKLYSWKYSLVYDGIEESCIGGDIGDSDVSSGAEYYTITVTAEYGAYSTHLFNHRLTGINIYRADSLDGTTNSLGLYRKVAEIDINHSQWETSVQDKFFRINDEGTYWVHPISGVISSSDAVSYDENSGISQTLDDVSANFELSCTGNGHCFVGKCYISGISDTSRYIFRSKSYRYDIFDWTNDFLIMSEPMTAMEFYDGKLWVFSNNKAYRVNPEGMYIEDELDNVGAQGQRSVHCNESGMFVGNKLNAWMYQGGTFYPIGDAIRQSASGGKSWQTFLFTTLTDFIVTSDAKKGYILFINERTAPDTSVDLFCWAYNITKKRWDAFSFNNYAISANAGAFKGKDGEVYLSNGTATYQLMRHSTNRQLWEWVSQEFSFGKTRQTKSLTMIKVDATGTVSITYGVDGATPATAGTSEALINTQIKNVRIKLNANAATSTNYVDSMEVIYRMLVGNR